VKRALAILIIALLSACSTGGAPDMGPVGGGLSVIGLGIVVAAFIKAVAVAIRHNDENEEGDEDA